MTKRITALAEKIEKIIAFTGVYNWHDLEFCEYYPRFMQVAWFAHDKKTDMTKYVYDVLINRNNRSKDLQELVDYVNENCELHCKLLQRLNNKSPLPEELISRYNEIMNLYKDCISELELLTE